MAEAGKARTALSRKHPARGAPPKAAEEEQLLMMPMYYRAYRTFLHTATSYGCSESQAWRIVRKMKDMLPKSGAFRLPGKKALLKMQGEVPGKSSAAITQAKRKDTPGKSA